MPRVMNPATAAIEPKPKGPNIKLKWTQAEEIAATLRNYMEKERQAAEDCLKMGSRDGAAGCYREFRRARKLLALVQPTHKKCHTCGKSTPIEEMGLSFRACGNAYVRSYCEPCSKAKAKDRSYTRKLRDSNIPTEAKPT